MIQTGILLLHRLEFCFTQTGVLRCTDWRTGDFCFSSALSELIVLELNFYSCHDNSFNVYNWLKGVAGRQRRFYLSHTEMVALSHALLLQLVGWHLARLFLMWKVTDIHYCSRIMLPNLVLPMLTVHNRLTKCNLYLQEFGVHNKRERVSNGEWLSVRLTWCKKHTLDGGILALQLMWKSTWRLWRETVGKATSVAARV